MPARRAVRARTAGPRPVATRPRPALLDWAARTAVVLGGFGLLRLLPASRPVAVVPTPEQDEQAGRGRHATPPSTRARAAGHETQDLSGGTLTWLVLGLGATAALVAGGLYLLVDYMDATRAADLPRYTAQQIAPVSPPKPNLEAAPEVSLAELRAREHDLLSNYAWVDPARTRARIPIDRAMTLIVGRPLDTAP